MVAAKYHSCISDVSNYSSTNFYVHIRCTDGNIRDYLLLNCAFIISDVTQSIVLQFVQNYGVPKAKKLKIYIYVISNVIIYNLFISLFYLILLCSLILSFCNTIFNLFFTLLLCNIYFYFVIRYYHNVFDIFKSLFLSCVFIL